MTHNGEVSELAKTFPTAIPPELSRHNIHHVSPRIRRATRDISPTGIQVYNSRSKEIEFKLPNNGAFDYGRAYLSFDVTLSSTGAAPTHLRVANGIWSLFRAVELREDDKVVSRQDYVNQLMSLMYRLGKTAHNDVNTARLWGIGTQAVRNANGTTTRTYHMPLMCPALTNEIIHAHSNIHHGHALRLKYTLEDNLACLETSAGTTPDFEIRNVLLSYESLDLPDIVKSGVIDHHNSRGVKTVFDDYSFSFLPFETQLVNHVFNPNKKSVKNLLTWFLTDGERTDPTVNDKFEIFINPDPREYQHEINERKVQERAVTFPGSDASEAYAEFLRYVGFLEGAGNFRDGPGIDYDAYITNGFIIALDLNTARDNSTLLNNVNANTENDIQIRVDLNAAPADRLVAVTLTHYMRIWNHGAGLGRITQA